MGFIIVIEGCDGSGKQVQTKKLYDRLKEKNLNVISQSFPNYESDSSAPVKMYLNGELSTTANELDAYQSSILFATDRLCTYQKYLKKYYENNSIIILDRYVQSNMFHQGGKIKSLQDRDKFLNWLDDLEFNALKLPRPDIVIFLDMPPEVSIKLAKQRKDLKSATKKDIHEDDYEYLINSYKVGLEIAKKFNWNIIHCMNGDKIKSVEEIHEEIFNSINKLL